jgi:uncharacterized protein YijF (DUF1287 family)
MKILRYLLLIALATAPLAHADDIVAAARKQIGITLRYDPAYRRIAFPNGDVPLDRGVCTDVVIRALRDAKQLDLQREVNADMQAHRDAYPRKWRVAAMKPDANIDHRRVPNQMTYFTRRGWSLPVSSNPDAYLPGDIVAWNLGGDVLHIGIVSDNRFDGRPLVIHNIGNGAREEDILLRFEVIGHYRVH